MGNPASRFRRLPPPRLPARIDGFDGMEGRTAQESTILRDPPDLFAHFGVDLRPEVGEAGPVIAATACPDCGWWQRADDPATCCPLCARQHETSDPVDVAS